MGNFIATIEAVGNHGCQRDIPPGDPVHGCGQTGCTDCIIRECVAKLKAIGTNVTKATIQHWPDQKPEAGPVDDLLTWTRDKSFSPPPAPKAEKKAESDKPGQAEKSGT